MTENVGEFKEEGRAEGCLKFRFPTYEEFRQIQKQAGRAVDSGVSPAAAAAFCSRFTSAENNNSARASIDELGEGEREINENNLKQEVGAETGITDPEKSHEGGFRRNHEVLAYSVITDSDSESSTEEDDNNSESNANELEPLWEHQELLEQLRMELNKVKATGLPTILEESDSLKMTDDLKPWKIDEFRCQDCIGELHKLYRSYRERMRKFDVINYQKMYAMGVLQLRDHSVQFMSKPKHPPSALKSLLRAMLKNRIHGGDDYPMKRFVEELQADLEAVYVGQMCLSWEFLQWQYEKALDLWDNDPQGIRCYNEVAGEFQQFQVLLQRFVEDEPFQDQPRMQYYVNARCLNRKLLQVPVTREDKTKDRRKKVKYDYAITSDELVEIMEESIRIFWRFLRNDRDCCASTSASSKKMVHVFSPEDLKILVNTQKILLKKDRKVKDHLRSENCMLRKFPRWRKDSNDLDQVLYFFSQVDMKLVGRVLNMSRITRDQIIWCRNKLDRISFDSRRIHLEPAFFLFPC